MRTSRGIAQKSGVLDLLENSSNKKLQWLRSLFGIYDSADLIHLDLPWWTYSAIDAVEAYLTALGGQARVFEYGAGASTVWLAKRSKIVITTEHDSGFASSMHSTFAQYDNIRLQVVPPVPATHVPGEARSKRKGYSEHGFDDYVNSITCHPGSFDLIVIDGRARTACLDKARERLADGGMILFDNSDRAEYRALIASSGLEERRYSGLAPALPIPSQTSLLLRRN